MFWHSDQSFRFSIYLQDLSDGMRRTQPTQTMHKTCMRSYEPGWNGPVKTAADEWGCRWTGWNTPTGFKCDRERYDQKIHHKGISRGGCRWRERWRAGWPSGKQPHLPAGPFMVACIKKFIRRWLELQRYSEDIRLNSAQGRQDEPGEAHYCTVWTQTTQAAHSKDLILGLKRFEDLKSQMTKIKGALFFFLFCFMSKNIPKNTDFSQLALV